MKLRTLTRGIQWLFAAAFLSIVVIVLVRARNYSRATSEATTRPAPVSATPVSNELTQVSPALVGRLITVRGKYSFWTKLGPCILLDNEQGVYLDAEAFAWEPPYTFMEGQTVTATGILRFYRAGGVNHTHLDMPGLPDYFYFDARQTPLRLIGPGNQAFRDGPLQTQPLRDHC